MIYRALQDDGTLVLVAVMERLLTTRYELTYRPVLDERTLGGLLLPGDSKNIGMAEGCEWYKRRSPRILGQGNLYELEGGWGCLEHGNPRSAGAGGVQGSLEKGDVGVLEQGVAGGAGRNGNWDY